MEEAERLHRQRELRGVIAKAEAELKVMEPSKSFLMELQETLDAMDSERASGEDYDTVARSLGNMAAATLNMLNDRVQGEVAVHNSGEVTVGTDVGDLRYSDDEWYFLERP